MIWLAAAPLASHPSSSVRLRGYGRAARSVKCLARSLGARCTVWAARGCHLRWHRSSPRLSCTCCSLSADLPQAIPRARAAVAADSAISGRPRYHVRGAPYSVATYGGAARPSRVTAVRSDGAVVCCAACVLRRVAPSIYGYRNPSHAFSVGQISHAMQGAAAGNIVASAGAGYLTTRFPRSLHPMVSGAAVATGLAAARRLLLFPGRRGAGLGAGPPGVVQA